MLEKMSSAIEDIFNVKKEAKIQVAMPVIKP